MYVVVVMDGGKAVKKWFQSNFLVKEFHEKRKNETVEFFNLWRLCHGCYELFTWKVTERTFFELNEKLHKNELLSSGKFLLPFNSNKTQQKKKKRYKKLHTERLLIQHCVWGLSIRKAIKPACLLTFFHHHLHCEEWK